MKNLVLIAATRIGKKDLGVDYTNWSGLAEAGFNAWKSAVNYVNGGPTVRLQHLPSGTSSVQDNERAMLSEALERHLDGYNLLILEADTICLGPVDLFDKYADSTHLQLFNFASSGTEEFPVGKMLNSGVIFWPSRARIVRPVLDRWIRQEEWPERWAFYQEIWNEAYYRQFSSKRDSKNLDGRQLGSGADRLVDGSHNFFIDSPITQVDPSEVRIAHFFSSRDVANVVKMQELSTRYGLPKALQLSQANNAAQKASNQTLNRAKAKLWRVFRNWSPS